MPKKTEPLQCTEQERRQLEWIVSSNAEGPKVILRARMMLSYLENPSVPMILRDYQVSRGVFMRWKERFERYGVNGLWDKPHPGKPPLYDEAFEKRLLAMVGSEPPKGAAHWNGQMLADELNASGDAVWRILRKNGISLARQRVWQVPVKASMVHMQMWLAGVFIAPPVWLAVITGEDISGLESHLVTRSHLILEKLTEAMAGNKFLSLEAAISVCATVPSNISEANRRREALRFLEDIESNSPGTVQYQILCFGDLPFAGVGSWQTEHPRMRFVFLPFPQAGNMNFQAYLPADLEWEYMPLHQMVISYPPDAYPLIWKKVWRSQQT